MSINVSSNFLLAAHLPLDARTIVANNAARDAIPAIQRYDGLVVYVVASQISYQLKGGILNANWAVFGSGGGGGVTNPLADDSALVFGTTSPTSLLAQVAGQTVKNFTIAPSVTEPIVLINRSDIGSDVFATDITPFLSSPALIFCGASPLVQDFFVIMSIGLNAPNDFGIFGVGGNTIGGTPRNLDGISITMSGGDSGSLGGIPGAITLKAGTAQFGNTDGADVQLQAGQASGTGGVGRVLLSDHVRIAPASTAFAFLEFANCGSIPVSNAGEGIIKFDQGLNQFVSSSNGSAYTAFGGGGDLVAATLATASAATANTINNSDGVTFNIPASGVDSGIHHWRFGTAGQLQFQVQGTFDGVGGLASGLIVFGTPGVPSAFNWIGGDALIPATNALDWIYQGGKGGHNNPGADAGRGSNFQAASGAGGDGADNSHLPGDAGQIIFAGGPGGAGSGAFIGGTGGTIDFQSGPGGASGGAGIGNYGNVQFTSNIANISMIGANSTIVTTVATNETNSWQVRDSSGGNPNWIQCNTSTITPSIIFGDLSTNPNFTFNGTGEALFNGNIVQSLPTGINRFAAFTEIGTAATPLMPLVVDLDTGSGPDGGIFSLGSSTISSYIAFEPHPVPTGNVLPGSYNTAFDRMFWYPRQAAFRAGIWDTANAGAQSIGFGSASFGVNAQASGDFSFACGTDVTASGKWSTAFGQVLTASGDNSFVFGGLFCAATGNYSIAGGTGATSGGNSSISLGSGTVASADFSVALGSANHADGIASVSLGTQMIVSGDHSFGINLATATPFTLAQSNSMAIMGGNVGIGQLVPNYPLHVAGAIGMDGATSGSFAQSANAVTTTYSIVWPAAQGAAGTTIQNDGAGNLTWVSSAFNGALGNGLYTEVYSATAPGAGINNMNDFDMTFTNPGAPITATINGLIVKESFGASWVAGGGDFVGILSNVVSSLAGSFTTSSETGFKASLQSSGLSNITTVRGYEVVGSFTHAGNVVTNYEAYHVSAPTTGGTITNAYGLYVDNLTSGTNNYGIYVAGASTYAIWTASGVNRFDGDILTTHVVGQGSTPGVAANAGSAGTASIVGTDIAGTVSTTTGVAPTAAAAILTVTFAIGFAAAPYVQLTPANAATALLSGVSMVYVTETTTTFVINAGSAALAGLTAYSWNYEVIG